jgi:hypothetical protein
VSRSILVLALFGAGCASVPFISEDVDAPPGALRVASVANIATRLELVQNQDFYKILLAAGIEDKDIVDGSVIRTQVHCCDGPDVTTYGMAWVPAGLELQRGDIVEIRVALDPEEVGLKRFNVVTQVRQPRDAKPSRCDWIPPQPGLWRRTIFCDWMPSEGWVEVRSWGLPYLWMKPASSPP